MASTYTSNIRLTKQGDGENPNSWGTLINIDRDLVDEAIAGYVTVTMSSVDVTLTSNNGATDQSRHAFIEIVGAVTDSVNLIIPANTKGYTVINTATVSAGTSITMKTAAGSGYNIAAASNQHVVCDGVSVVGLNLAGMDEADNSAYVQVSNDSTITGAKTFSSATTFTGPVVSPIVTLTDAASVAMDLSTGNHFELTLGGNRTLSYPSNGSVGQVGHIYLIQDGTGSRTLSYNNSWKFPSGTAPTLTTSINSVDMLCFAYRNTSVVDAVIINDLKR